MPQSGSWFVCMRSLALDPGPWVDLSSSAEFSDALGGGGGLGVRFSDAARVVAASGLSDPPRRSTCASFGCSGYDVVARPRAPTRVARDEVQDRRRAAAASARRERGRGRHL